MSKFEDLLDDAAGIVATGTESDEWFDEQSEMKRKELLREVRTLVDEVIGGNVDGEPSINMILRVQRQRADELFGKEASGEASEGE